MDFQSLFESDFSETTFFIDQNVDILPDLGSHFSVPPLPDKPQDPIMDTLESVEAIPPLPSSGIRVDALPTGLAVLDTAHADPLTDRPLDMHGLWHEALSNPRLRNQALHWDRLRPENLPDKPFPTPFISEQNLMVFSAARYQLQSPSLDSNVDRIYVSQAEFLSALRTIILGVSSVYHAWDAKQENFVYINAEGRQCCFIVDGKDEVICRSITRRFLTIGTLIRRMEALLVTLRARSANDGATIHAFAHSISTILTYLREGISRCSAMVSLQGQQLSAIHMQYAIYEDILIALSSLYGRNEDVPSQDYPPIESAPIPLLNRIYGALMLHTKRQSNRIVIAIFAFILTNTSQDYLRDVSRTVGYGTTYVRKSTHVIGERPDQYAMDEVEEEEQVNDIFEAMEKLGTEFPSFFPRELVKVISAAQKSLILLQEAYPEHPLLLSPEGHEPVHWFWTEREIDDAWNKIPVTQEKTEPELGMLPPKEHPSQEESNPEFAEFWVFDQDPGSCMGQSAMRSENNAVEAFRAFVGHFPERLPPITPTLSHLASLVFSNLVEHALKLSDALLLVFLSSDGNLNLRAHLELLRSFLLVSYPAFESRLAAALFSDAEEYELDMKQNGMSLHSLRRRRKNNLIPGTQTWAVGLAAALSVSDDWPPVDADLGFFLRTVIVDSVGTDNKEASADRDKVWEEAEYRLGFAIRDLPVGPSKWSDRLSIEALDFLYMDYKPPHALEVLITPDILSKYQRIFAFILRLMRVTHAIKAVHRMSRSTRRPLFQTLVKYRKLMLHFRFVAHSFVSNLSAYIFDSAIGGNFDPFIERLAATATAASSTAMSTSMPVTPVTERFSDIFSLSQTHSELLDNILSACLLRSGQREVGDILRQSLELVLDFSVVIGELHRGRLEEYQAGPRVEDVFAKFRGKMLMFTRVLKELAEKTGGMSPTRISREELHEGQRQATGGMEALAHVLIKLDMGRWWQSRMT
ncbi:hypothetical protein APHAL10511_003787 [Amanita phalloides]|nr:hypothetical protein APHAL10511_003787 [Amanita phalloides]